MNASISDCSGKPTRRFAELDDRSEDRDGDQRRDQAVLQRDRTARLLPEVDCVRPIERAFSVVR